ncbi:MFS transporter [Nocardia sp. NPDC060256]|uniref:MFS transporter n=1 Tax=unclassified Nocardia TaxID=2637762 RepID=UPI003669C23C
MDAPTVGLRGNRNWQKLWLGQLISVFGDFVFDITLVLWVGSVIAHGRSWAPLAVSGVLVAAAIPIVVVGPIAGVFVDRWDRRRTMMIADLLRAGLIGVLVVVAIMRTVLPVWATLAAVYAVVAATAAVAQFFNPSRFATVAAVVAEQDRPRAFGLTSASANAAAILGPPLAAPLLFSMSAVWALVVNMVSFLISYALIRSTALAPQQDSIDKGTKNFRAEFADGVRFVSASPILRLILVTVFLYMFGVGAVNALQIFFVGENLRVDPSCLGVLEGAFGAGSIIGALATPRLVSRIGERRVFAFGVLATALVAFAYSRSTSLYFAIGMLGLVGIPVAAVNVALSPIILREAPNRLIGRVNAVLNPLVYLASVSSMVLAGIVASGLPIDFRWSLSGIEFHRVDTIFAFCGLLMLVAGCVVTARMTSLPETGATDNSRAAVVGGDARIETNGQ